MTSKSVKDIMQAAVEAFANANSLHYVKNQNYTDARKPPRDQNEWIRTRFPSSAILRDEIGGTDEDGLDGDNLYEENAAFRIDIAVRIHSRGGPGTEPPSQIVHEERLDEIKQLIVDNFLGRTFSNVEIFGIQDGLDVSDVDVGFWTESLSIQFHFEHFGP